MFVSPDPELAALRETVREFVDSFGVDYFRERYRNREYPHELYDAVVDRGWIGLTVPERYGGRGRSHRAAAVWLEPLGTYGYDFGMPALLSTSGAETVVRFGTDEQIERFVAPALDGERRFSIGVTEPDTGSDAAALETRAERDGETYVLSGSKTYQSAAKAPGNTVILYARTDADAPKREGISAFLLPIDAAGVELSPLDLVARRAAGTYDLELNDVRIPASNRLGAAGDGWTIMNDHLRREHTYMAALMAGNARGAIEATIDATTDRERFGRPVSEFQAISHRIAELQTEVDAARLLVGRAAARLDAGTDSRQYAAQAKLYAGETLRRVGSEAVQLLGGAGLDPENDVERYWREGASATIAGGTSEIQRSVIAAAVLD